MSLNHIEFLQTISNFLKKQQQTNSVAIFCIDSLMLYSPYCLHLFIHSLFHPCILLFSSLIIFTHFIPSFIHSFIIDTFHLSFICSLSQSHLFHVFVFLFFFFLMRPSVFTPLCVCVTAVFVLIHRGGWCQDLHEALRTWLLAGTWPRRWCCLSLFLFCLLTDADQTGACPHKGARTESSLWKDQSR